MTGFAAQEHIAEFKDGKCPAYCGTLTLGELMAGGPAEQHQREQEFQMGGM